MKFEIPRIDSSVLHDIEVDTRSGSLTFDPFVVFFHVFFILVIKITFGFYYDANISYFKPLRQHS